MWEKKFERRRLLSYAATMLAAAPPLATCGRDPSRRSTPAPETGVPNADEPVVESEHVYSQHRRSTVELVLAYPSDLDGTDTLPMALYLHGPDRPRPTAIPHGALAALEREDRTGSNRSFGFVAVDGGHNAYWHDQSASGDVLSMLLDELPGWLIERGLADTDGLPFACAGVSSGGFGALNYAIERSRRGAPVDAVGAVSPALPVSWEQTREKGPFDDEHVWRRLDPLQNLAELGGTPVGVWVGDDDPFLDGALRLMHDYSNTPITSVSSGGSGGIADPEGLVRFLAEQVPAG